MKRALIPLGMTPLLLGSCGDSGQKAAQASWPNILVAIADDQSYPYASAYGTPGIQTPAFDYIASRGCCFSNAYACSPGSSPSRASLLTGLYPWQIEEAGTHASAFPARYTCYPELLASFGYGTGFTGKGWGPGNWEVSGRKENPAGPEFNGIHLDRVPCDGISDIDYAGNFKVFLDSLEPGTPFCFWYGAKEPHRPYTPGSGIRNGVNPDGLLLPDDLPDAREVRSDLADYIREIEWFDTQLGVMLEELDRRNLLQNTIVVVTADNGMPFPHAKANCYDGGTHVPLAICWGDRIKKHGIEPAIVSLVDLFPSFLEWCEIDWEGRSGLSGRSLSPLLGITDGVLGDDAAFSGRERHSSARPDNMGYPSRAIRTGKWLLIHNFHPERWPAGDPRELGHGSPYDGYYDIDGSPTLRFLIDGQDDVRISPYFQLATGKRPEFELFDLEEDPACTRNLYGNSAFRTTADSLQALLRNKLLQSGDSRLGDRPEIWESYPRLAGSIRSFPATTP